MGNRTSIFTQVWIAFQQEASLVGTSMWQKLTSDEGTHMDVVWTWTCECNHCNVKRKGLKLLHDSEIWRKYLIEEGLFKCHGKRKSFESGLWMVTQLGMFMIFHDGYTTALSWLQDWWKRSLSLALRSFYPVWANFGRTGRAVAIALVLDCMSRGYPWIVSACFDASIYWRMEQQGCKDNNMLDGAEDRFWKTVIIFLPPTVDVRMRELQKPWNFKATTPRWPWRRRLENFLAGHAKGSVQPPSRVSAKLCP